MGQAILKDQFTKHILGCIAIGLHPSRMYTHRPASRDLYSERMVAVMLPVTTHSAAPMLTDIQV